MKKWRSISRLSADVVKTRRFPEIEKKTEEFYCEEQEYKYIVKHDRLDILKFLNERYDVECAAALFYAARYNELELVKYIDTLGAEFYEDFVEDVVKYGSLERLIYCHGRLCRYLGSDRVSRAEEYKQRHVSAWIKNELGRN